MVVAVEQTVIHAPGVDAAAVQLTDVCLLEGKQPLLELAVKIRQIPVEYAVHLYIVIFKAVQLTHDDPLAVELPQDRASV